MRVPPLVVPHASFGSLLNAISREWLAGPRSPVPAPIVIPSIPFSDHLQRHIADRCGVCMGFDFLTSQDFIHRATGPLAADEWSRAQLAWRILPHIAPHAATLGVADPTPRDRFALAGLAADRFDQYGHFRPEILRAWIAGRPATKDDATAAELADETWQRALWGELRATAREPHPAERFEKFRQDAAFRQRLVEAFPRLLVIGSGVVDPLLVEVLDLLADAGGRVEVHVVLPSLEYLGDLRSRRVLPPAEQDPEDIGAEAGHPLLESMGRHAVGTFLLLGRLDDQYTHWPEAGRTARTEGSLLRRLQTDIRSVRPPSSHAPSPEDRSLRVHSCFGPRREMEVLKDEILRAFTELPDLRPEEVHIMTAAPETYAPLVAAILEQGDNPLSVRLLERPAGGREPAIEAMLALLEMARGGEFEASRLLELVTLEAVQTALRISGDEGGGERLRDWIRDSGITHGLGESGDARPGTWGYSRDRLVAGRWFGPDDSVRYPDGSFVLPVAAQLAGDEELGGRFIAWFEALEAAMREWRTPADAPEWAARLGRVCGTVLGGDDEARLALQPHVAFLGGVEGGEAVDAGTILDWLEAGSREAVRRAPVSGRIAFGRFKQLQNIPCRVLAMVGLQEGTFPGQNRPLSWDLLRQSPRAWDRNARIDDRQLFLDGLLTPGDRLIITASTRNVRTRKTEPFSACVDELLRVTALMGIPRESVVVEHRLQPFAADYFVPGGGTPRSFSAEFAHVATEFERAGAGAQKPFWNADAMAESPIPAEITVPDLVAFWRDPAKAFLRAQGVVIPGDEDDDEALDRAAITLDGLAGWTVRNAIVEELVAGRGELDRVEAGLRADRGLPPGHLGSSVWDASRALGEPLGRSVKRSLGARLPLSFPLPDGPTIIGEIQTDGPGDHLLAYRAGDFRWTRDLLDPWIRAVLAAACGQPRATHLFDPSNPVTPRELAPISTAGAAATLADLVHGFLNGQSRPLEYAPEVSNAYAKVLERKGETGAVSAAVAEWDREDTGRGGGEGTKPVARWAWRDRDPFADAAAWRDWAERIAAPLHEWGNCP